MKSKWAHLAPRHPNPRRGKRERRELGGRLSPCTLAALSPDVRLRLAMLQCAINELNHPKPKIARDAKAWLRGDYPSDPGFSARECREAVADALEGRKGSNLGRRIIGRAHDLAVAAIEAPKIPPIHFVPGSRDKNGGFGAGLERMEKARTTPIPELVREYEQILADEKIIDADPPVAENVNLI